MGKQDQPPPLADPDAYLEQHLSNELHWLLRAANEWTVQNDLKLGVDGYHVQVYAMDSAFLHARTLFEFLTGTRTKRNYFTVDQFGLTRPLKSGLYDNGWKSALHEYLMHAQARDDPQPLIASDGTSKHLKFMAPDFAAEVIRLWGEFVKELRELGSHHRADAAETVLNEARAQAAPVLTSKMAMRLRRGS